MRRFALLIVGGGLLFLALAIADEWSYFSTAWFGSAEAVAVAPPTADGAEGALRAYLGEPTPLGGEPVRDARAGEPKQGREVLGELAAEREFLASRGWSQRQALARLVVDQVTPVAPGRAEILTREWWTVTLRRSGSAEETLRSQVRCRYYLARSGSTWVVVRWDALPPGDFAAGPDPSEETP